MSTRTWLLVAAEEREFSGVLGRLGAAAQPVAKLHWPGAKFAREAAWKGDRWWMIANGPGPRRIHEALAMKKEVNGIISTGFCGALDPALRLGDVVVSADATVTSPLPFVRGPLHSVDRVAVTAAEKRELRSLSGAAAVEMEAAAVEQKAREWGIPFSYIRVVSDTAHGDLPLDFNHYRDAQGNFSRTRIALAALARPFSVLPELLAFDRQCQRAAHSLGDFLADCQF